MNLDKAIRDRHSSRNFSTKKPDWRKIIEAIDSARYAPTAGEISALKFIIIDKQEKINQIAKHTQQDFITQVQYVVIVCSSRKLMQNAFPKQSSSFLRQQAGAGIQNFLLKLTELGLNTCWIGAFIEDKIKTEFSIPDDVDVEAIFPIGYEMHSKRSKKLPPMDGMLFFNKYNNKKMWEAKSKGDH